MKLFAKTAAVHLLAFAAVFIVADCFDRVFLGKAASCMKTKGGHSDMLVSIREYTLPTDQRLEGVTDTSLDM